MVDGHSISIIKILESQYTVRNMKQCTINLLAIKIKEILGQGVSSYLNHNTLCVCVGGGVYAEYYQYA